MSPVLVALAYGFGAVCVLAFGLLLWAAWASRGMIGSEDLE